MVPFFDPPCMRKQCRKWRHTPAYP